MSGSFESPKIYSRMREYKEDFVALDDNLVTALVVVFMALPLVAIIIYLMYTYYILPGKDYSRQNVESPQASWPGTDAGSGSIDILHWRQHIVN